ncbi:MAG TPA: tetratricopeptide repeat protein [Steroidobacteraceae bacterium]|nr:tetratricopeptide repeat protein [Steroidobacteraceae bacterium]
MAVEEGFRIGDHEVHPRQGRIIGPRGESRIEPKAMAVLVELARGAPEPRSREQIIASVWPRGFVSDDVLTRCIGQLRRALADDPRAPRCLETLPKLGYRLKCAVEPLARAAAVPPARSGVESLIVLPFQNLSASSEDFVADGLTELLIARLAAFTGLRVISRTTAMRFKGGTAGVTEIAQKTGSDWVIEGSVLQSGDRIQVVAQLIDARTDAHVWAADYVRDLQDLLSLQNEIVARVASAIRLQLGATERSPRSAPTLAPPVMRDYLKARHLLSRRTIRDLTEARSILAAVTGAAPDHASGWASLAESEMLLAHYGAAGIAELLEDCERNLERALTLEPDLAIGLATRGALRFFFRREFDGAAADLGRALTLLPSYAMAMLSLANVCAVRGHFADASAWMDQALLVDPLDVGINMNMGDHLILQRRYQDAAAALRGALALSPQHRPSALRLCWALALAGEHAEALALLEDLRREGDDDPQWHEYAALVAGLRAEPPVAAREYEWLERAAKSARVPPWTLARAACAAGRQQTAIDWLEQAAGQRSSSLPFMRVTPAFDPLHGEQRFISLGHALGLPEPGASAPEARRSIVRTPG